MKKHHTYTVMSLLVIVLFSCAGTMNIESRGVNSIMEKNMRSHIKFLGHDLLEGRGVGTRGIKIAQEYIAAQFALNGIEPALKNGSYFQPVPFVKVQAGTSSECMFSNGQKRLALKYKDEFLFFPGVSGKPTEVTGELVFAGYGITAPEYKWDDYKNSDVTGKVVLVLMGEPSSKDSTLFNGSSYTEYSQLDKKRETALENGARGIVYIITQKHPRYRWERLKTSLSRKRTVLDIEEGNQPVKIQCVISEEAAQNLFGLSSISFADISEKAEYKDFQASPLGVKISAMLKSKSEKFECRNVAGIIPGKKREEYIIYIAHTDHLGIGTPVEGDSIYNGAVDNGIGCASILEIGRAFSNLPERPERSIVFLAVTAEEIGFYGAEYYTKKPVFPLEKTLAVINIDGPIPMPEMKNFVFFGEERSTLGQLLNEIAKDNGMTVTPDPYPEEGFYTRSDHYRFAQAGVPGGMLDTGTEVVGKDEGWSVKHVNDWLQTLYHKPNDEYSDDWDMEAIVQIAKIGFQLGYRLTKAAQWPEWYDNQPFKKIRRKHFQTGRQ